MNNVYVISDLHFGHKNQAKRRGFDSVEAHDAHIIEQWNTIVDKKDTVWILGDVTYEKASLYPMLDELKGIKKVVMGNHDLPQHASKLLNHVHAVCGMFEYKDLVLTHCPVHEQELHKFSHNIHGHLHEHNLDDPRYINVCCEQVNYQPQLLKNYCKTA